MSDDIYGVNIGVDAIFLGEELLYKSNNITIQDRVRKWFSEKSIV